MRVRGLKPYEHLDKEDQAGVAPRAGAWIETVKAAAAAARQSLSHPVRVRGLKLRTALVPDVTVLSHPVRVRGLKQDNSMRFLRIMLRRTPCGCVD